MSFKLLVDIKSANNSLRNTPRQINLQYTKLIRIPIKYIASVFLVLFFIISFVFNPAFAPVDGDAQAAVLNSEERRALEIQLAELEKQIAEDEKTIAEYKKQGSSLQSEINRLNSNVAKLNSQIKAISLNLKKLDQNLNETQNQIVSTVSKIDLKKEIIQEIIQNIYQNENQSVLMILLSNNKISDFFSEVSRLSSIQDRLRINVDELMGLHTDLSNQKETLALEKEDVISLKAYQEAQRLAVQKSKQEKDYLLKVTKGKESEYQKIVAAKKQTAAEIRGRIFEFLGGGALSFGEAYKLAKVAEDETGVRAALILAVLDKESALGKNVGKCRYDINPYYPARASNKTTMHPTRDIPIFLEITKKLNLDPTVTLVSCPIPSDGAYGGAMGPAQFIPSTWKVFESKIADALDKKNVSPWTNMDAFMGTALYLKSAGAAGASLYQEKVAAAKYYAGGNWSRHINGYGARVVERAQAFEDDIRVLSGLAMR